MIHTTHQQSISQLTTPRNDPPIVRFINQFISPSINQSIDRSINQSISQSTNRSISQQWIMLLMSRSKSANVTDQSKHELSTILRILFHNSSPRFLHIHHYFQTIKKVIGTIFFILYHMHRHFHLNSACSRAFAQDKIVSASKSAFINQKVELLFLKKTLITTFFYPFFLLSCT